MAELLKFIFMQSSGRPFLAGVSTSRSERCGDWVDIMTERLVCTVTRTTGTAVCTPSVVAEYYIRTRCSTNGQQQEK
jgi:hypothetical protein